MATSIRNADTPCVYAVNPDVLAASWRRSRFPPCLRMERETRRRELSLERRSIFFRTVGRECQRYGAYLGRRVLDGSKRNERVIDFFRRIIPLDRRERFVDCLRLDLSKRPCVRDDSRAGKFRNSVAVNDLRPTIWSSARGYLPRLAPVSRNVAVPFARLVWGEFTITA